MSEGRLAADKLIARTRHIFLSPHYDDVALSCGGTAALLARADRAPEVALIFGDYPDLTQPMTEFAESLHRQWGLDAAEVIAGRRAEEAAAGERLGTTAVFLPFRDAIYRGGRYTSDDLLFGTPCADEHDLPTQIVAALPLPPEANPEVRLYAPLGIGRHVDHQHGFAVGVALVAAGWEVWFYEDLPYALQPNAREERLQELGVRLGIAALVDIAEVWGTKIDAIMAYPSQLGVVFGYVGSGSTRAEIDAVMQAYARQVGNGVLAERFWQLANGDRRVPDVR